MEIGLAFALFASISSAIAQVTLRRGVLKAGESSSAVFISIASGTVLFTITLSITGEWDKLYSLSWQGFTLLALGGITHYIAGRLLNYNCVRLIGANKAGILATTSIFYSVFFGVLFLGEQLTVLIVLGSLCIISGAAAVSIGREDKFSGMRGWAIPIGLLAGFCWGISGVMVKPAIIEIGSPVAAVFISYLASFIIVASFLLRRSYRQRILRLRSRSLIFLGLSSLFVSIAYIMKFFGLSYSPVSMVQPLANTNIFFILLFSFIVNRKIESFNWKIITGMVIVVVGGFLFFL
ncbi:DMT family transporter [Chloroflexota bacterium]